jgi:membrane-associated phospholipid phosphatase
MLATGAPVALAIRVSGRTSVTTVRQNSCALATAGKGKAMIVENTALKTPTRRAVARWISIIVHPIVYPLVTLAILTYAATNGNLGLSFRFLLLALALTSLPVTLLVGYQVARGHWTDLDVSVRKQRYFLYPFGLAGLILLAIAFKWLSAPAVTVKAAVAFVVANLADGAINFWYKVSAHATSAAVCATLLTIVTPALAVPSILAAVAVAWSRVELGRHTIGQVILGAGVGVASVVATFAVGRF